MWPALVRFFDSSPASHPQRLLELLDLDGGFTVRLRSGAFVSSGISVCTRPSQSMSFARHEWDDRVVDEWVMSAAAQPIWRSSAIGGWLDPSSGTVWLDVVRVVPAPFRMIAMLLGRASNQHCVFDLGTCQTLVVR
ncbi:MAG: hypothetical protein ABI862_08725 [Ilumatobacteraceae bacterium]